jgi:hypothetical protein
MAATSRSVMHQVCFAYIGPAIGQKRMSLAQLEMLVAPTPHSAVIPAKSPSWERAFSVYIH